MADQLDCVCIVAMNCDHILPLLYSISMDCLCYIAFVMFLCHIAFCHECLFPQSVLMLFSCLLHGTFVRYFHVIAWDFCSFLELCVAILFVFLFNIYGFFV